MKITRTHTCKQLKNQKIKAAKNEIKTAKLKDHEEKLKEIRTKLDQISLKLLECVLDKSTSNWLGSLPLKDHGFHLDKRSF